MEETMTGIKQVRDEFREAAEKIELEVQKALLPLGYFADSVSGGQGRIEIQARIIKFERPAEIQTLEYAGLLDFAKEKGLIP
jgi:hypothetical protein